MLLLVSACSGGGDAGDDDVTVPTLELVTTTLPVGTYGVAYDHKVSARGGVPPYTYSVAAGALPADVTLKAATGQVSGVLEEAGTFAWTIEVKDTAGGSVRGELVIEVAAIPLEITTADLPDGETDAAYSASLEATGGVAPITWAIASGALPGGVTLADSGRISGTPTEFGTFTVTARAEDADGSTAERAFTFTIANANPTITETRLPPARAGGPYEFQIEVTGGTAPYAFALSAGALPSGLTLDTEGLVAGVPDDEGTFRFTVEVTDANDRTDALEFMILAAAPFSIETLTLPLAILGDPYDVELVAVGGIPPYAWFLANETPLPAGLTLSQEGRITGTPTEGGDFTIRLRAADEGGTGLRSSRMYFLRVRDLRVYSAGGSVSFPPLCGTSTHVSYQTLDVDVPDSFAIADMNITLDIDYTDADSANSNEKLRVFMTSPGGRQVVFCGNSTGIRGGFGCGGTDGIQATYGPLGIPPQRPLSVFNGTNAQGTWRLRVAVVRPTTDATGACHQAGMINDVTLSLTPDSSSDPFIVVSGYRPNNLLTMPWLRISGGGIAAQQELFLAATLWDVGANGRREAGGGDDMPSSAVFTWTGVDLPAGTTITPDGHVTSGAITSVGASPTITASDGGANSVTLPLAVVPPDWNPDVREF